MKKITLLTILILSVSFTGCSSGNKKENQAAGAQQNGAKGQSSGACDAATKAYKSCYYATKYGRFAAYVPGLSSIAGLAGRCNVNQLQLAQAGACLLKK